MSELKVQYFLLFCLIALTCGDLGDDCRFQSGGRGKCIIINQCPSAIQRLQDGITPVTCGFEGNNPIVCCEEDLAATQRRAPQSTDISQRRPYRYRFPKDNGGISIRMFLCSREEPTSPNVVLVHCDEEVTPIPKPPEPPRDFCQLPDGNQGICVPPHECPHLHRHMRQSVNCRARGFEPLVCCNVRHEPERLVNNNGLGFLVRPRSDFCELPNGDRGECVFIFQCPHISKILQAGIRPEVCGSIGYETLICCQTDPFALRKKQFEVCELPKGKTGECRLIYQCPYVGQLIQDGIQPIICGYEGPMVLVCCDMDYGFVNPIQIGVASRPSDQQDVCQLPDTEVGKCVPLFQCASALELLQQNISPITCGLQENERYVCCKIEDVVKTTSEQTIIQTTIATKENEPCQLPNNEIGNCLPLDQCFYAKQLLQQGVTPVTCESQELQALVCCQTKESVITVTEPYTTSTTSVGEQNKTCMLPSGETGDCLYIHQCPYVRKLLQNGIRPETCNDGRDTTMVCCKTYSTSTVAVETTSESGIPHTTLDASSTTPLNKGIIRPIEDFLKATESSTTENTTPSTQSSNTCQLSDGEFGQCLQIHQCTSARQLLQQGIRPVICDQGGTEALICCKVDVTTSTKDNIKTETTTATAITTSTSDSVTDKNETCQLSDGELGKCLMISQCPYARQMLQQGIRPVVCDSQGTEGYVCCKENNTITVKTKQEFDVENSISQQKCQEYYQEKEKATESILYNKPFVVGGVDALEKEFPNMVALGYGNSSENAQWLCGGSLISPNYVLTAAHCVYSQEYGQVRYARMGILNLKSPPKYVQDFVVVDAIRHPDYKPPLQYNDIALLKLNKDTEFTDYVKPACLYNKDDLPQARPIAIGWGKTQFNGQTSDILQKVVLTYFSADKCKDSFATVSQLRLPNGIDENSQICAGSPTEEKDTCQGDSGGPLQSQKGIRDEDKPFYVVGITSFGKACGIPNSPAVYTRVSHYVPWIESIVWS